MQNQWKKAFIRWLGAGWETFSVKKIDWKKKHSNTYILNHYKKSSILSQKNILIEFWRDTRIGWRSTELHVKYVVWFLTSQLNDIMLKTTTMTTTTKKLGLASPPDPQKDRVTNSGFSNYFGMEWHNTIYSNAK